MTHREKSREQHAQHPLARPRAFRDGGGCRHYSPSPNDADRRALEMAALCPVCPHEISEE